MQRRVWLMVGAVVLAAASAWWWLKPAEPTAGPSSGVVDTAEPPTLAETVGLTPDQVRARLFEQSARSGTEPPGSWCIQPEAGFKPCPDLRKRFEFFVIAMGGAPASEVRAAVAEQALRDHDDKTVAEITALWDRYWRLHEHAWKQPFDPADARTWRPAYEERHAARRRILGADWADSFFAADEAQLLTHIELAESGKPPSPGAMPRL